MKIYLSIFLMVTVLTFDAFAQSSVWKISKNGSDVFIGGTIHLLREQDFPLPDEFDEAYQSSSILVFETDINKMGSAEFQQSLMSKAIYSGDSTINDVLSAETMESLENECTALGLPFQQLQKLRPSVLILTIVVMHYQNLGINSPGVDAHYHKRATEDTKKILSLESIEEQINLIANMGAGNEDEFVTHSLEDLKRVKEELLTLIQAWKEGDVEESIKDLDEMKQNYPKLYEDLLLKRNEAWMPQIKELFDSEDTEFILVGNLHLHGTDGILKQLKDDGYKIIQVK